MRTLYGIQQVARRLKLLPNLQYVDHSGGTGSVPDALVIGLFTRLSAVVLALFLLSIILSQPAWLSGTVDTYNQTVECIALLVLASSHVGRWAGLDFFVHHLFLKPFRSR